MLTATHVAAQQSSDKTARAHGITFSAGKMGGPIYYAHDVEISGESEEAECVYYVVSGAVRTDKILNDGRRQIESLYLPGDVFCLEIDIRHAMSAESVCDCTISVIKRSSLTSLAGRDSDTTHAHWRVTALVMQRAQKHVLLLVRSAQERVASFLLEMVDRTAAGESVELPMPRRYIADYLGLNIETVSRAFTLLGGQAAIALPSARRIQITKVHQHRRLDS